MKALFLAVGAAALGIASVPASAQVISLGSSLAEACYRAAAAPNTSLPARDACDRALRDEPITLEDRFATHVNRGILRMFRRDYVAAASDFQAALQINSDRPEPWLNLGIMRLNQEDAAGSIPLLTRALELGTTDPALAYYARGLAHEYSGNVRAAYYDLTRAASLKPEWDLPARELARFQVQRR